MNQLFQAAGWNTNVGRYVAMVTSIAAGCGTYAGLSALDAKVLNFSGLHPDAKVSSLKGGTKNTVNDVGATGAGSHNVKFKSVAALEEHYGKHGEEIAKVLGKSNYSMPEYLSDANHIIENGTYVPELNGYVKFMSGQKYGFVGLDRTTGEITTFHIKTVPELIKNAPSLGFGK